MVPKGDGLWQSDKKRDSRSPGVDERLPKENIELADAGRSGIQSGVHSVTQFRFRIDVQRRRFVLPDFPFFRVQFLAREAVEHFP